MRPGHWVRLDGVPVTTPTRTLFDLAAAPDVSDLRMARLIDTAWARRLVSHASLTSMLAELAGKGRPGIVLMRELLEARPADHVPPESNTEARFEEIARLAGLRHLERQVDVGGDDGWIGRVDFIDRRRRLVVEVGDALFHGSLTDRRHDEVRWSRLEAAGYAVETVDAFEVFHRADTLVARLRAVANARNPLASGRTDDRSGGV
jgi:very-short-patch-repair endonuclease